MNRQGTWAKNGYYYRLINQWDKSTTTKVTGAVSGACCLRPLERYDCGLESLWRNGYMPAFLLCQCCPVLSRDLIFRRVLPPSKLAQAVALLTYTRVVLTASLGRDRDYPD
jgi:hypothetical protein